MKNNESKFVLTEEIKSKAVVVESNESDYYDQDELESSVKDIFGEMVKNVLNGNEEKIINEVKDSKFKEQLTEGFKNGTFMTADEFCLKLEELKTSLIKKEKMHRILVEEIQKVLENNKSRSILNEMSLPRKTYKQRVDDLIPQVLENWCLVHYCSIKGEEENKIHWKAELRGHIFALSRLSISGNDSAESRLKVLQELWDENDYSLPKFCNLTIANKFINEKVDISSEEYGKTILDCIESSGNLFNAILSRDINTINNYLESL